MRNLLIAFFLLTGYAYHAQCQQAPVLLDTLVKRLGDDVMNKPNSAGLSIGIYYVGQTSFYNFGTTERGEAKQPTKNTVYEIGSLTKTFVSLLLAQAVVEKKISLDDDIRKYLPGSYPNLQYNNHPITVLNLANATSGLPDVLPSVPAEMLKVPQDSIPVVVEKYYSTLGKKDLYHYLHNVNLDTVPGYYPRHSNCAAQLLGYIIESVYKKSLSQLFRQYILSPLQMQQTIFADADIGNRQLAKAYNNKGNPAPYFTHTYMQGSGGLHSSTADLIKYAAYMLEHKSAAAQLALKKNILIDAGTNKVIGTYPKDSVDDKVYSASLNWWQYNPVKGNEEIFADGGTMGFCSYIVLYPQANLAVVLLSNRSGGEMSGALQDIAEKIFTAVIPASK